MVQLLTVLAFDAALVIFTVFLLAKRSSFISLPAPHSTYSLKTTFFGCIQPLQHLDVGNPTISKCCRRLEKLGEVWNALGNCLPTKPSAAICDIYL
jgi:hypothetical protein